MLKQSDGSEPPFASVAQPRVMTQAKGAAPTAETIVIQRSGFRVWIDLAELWSYRYLLAILTVRDIKVRYKQTVLGLAWAVLQPLTTTIVLTLVFGRFAGLGANVPDVPYAVHVLAGLLLWTFFAGTVTTASQSLVVNAPLITKVYFPRFIVPLSSLGVVGVDLAVSAALLSGLMVYYGMPFHGTALLAPFLLLFVASAALGLASLLSALIAIYRDFRHVVPVALQLGFFLTPIVYPSSLLPAEWRPLLHLNPLTGMVEALRAVLFGRPIDWAAVAMAALICLVIFVFGVSAFRVLERRMADTI